MSRRLRKFQQGGIIPSYQAFQSMNVPLRPGQPAQPIAYNPNAAFQAIQIANQQRQAGISNLVSLANLGIQKERFEWQKDIDERNFIAERLTEVNSFYKSGMDSVSGLDLNNPSQQAKYKTFIEGLNSTVGKLTGIITNEDYKPNQKMELMVKETALFKTQLTDPDYQEMLQNNAFIDNVFNDVVTKLQDPTYYYNAENISAMIAQVDEFKSGKISRKQMMDFMGKNRLFAPMSELQAWEKDQYNLIDKSINPDKDAGTWETHKHDPNYIWTQKVVNVGSVDEQVEQLSRPFLDNPMWIKYSESIGRFVEEDAEGNKKFSEEAFKASLRDRILVTRSRYGLGEEAQTVVKDEKVLRTNSSTAASPRAKYGVVADIYQDVNFTSKNANNLGNLWNEGYYTTASALFDGSQMNNTSKILSSRAQAKDLFKEIYGIEDLKAIANLTDDQLIAMIKAIRSNTQENLTKRAMLTGWANGVPNAYFALKGNEHVGELEAITTMRDMIKHIYNEEEAKVMGKYFPSQYVGQKYRFVDHTSSPQDPLPTGGNEPIINQGSGYENIPEGHKSHYDTMDEVFGDDGN